ncbi:PQQ-dependent catabolism-associated CXXCW motif protein [Fulvimarina endophytica]|uniref:PQQ-dependent catabolism-associated CXXCW motif protein n=1 Tax=Fulvimarina endophytica TaxID=2293836 RepID=A0A371X028_9HYPH|nr:PQQ-dependent catabolism-associated CXXCW motif protein [Fulvimarina endophytica]RFC62593.1 PQQ-dependent catabolism-associated CXXCW motif protein [Fulvimarina endophytica]
MRTDFAFLGVALAAGLLAWSSVGAQTSAPGAAEAAGTVASPATSPSSPQAAVPEPDGYRMDDYRAPVPATLSGGTVVSVSEAKKLHDEGVPFVDVLPRPPRPKGLPADTYWHPKPRNDIPGSIWLPDTGYGELAPIMRDYLLSGLDKAVDGDRSRPVVIYCDRNCWMSYNAAKRAIASGFTGVHWLPEGAQGWEEAGYPLEPKEPVERPDE